jgi:hypothetical protein
MHDSVCMRNHTFDPDFYTAIVLRAPPQAVAKSLALARRHVEARTPFGVTSGHTFCSKLVVLDCGLLLPRSTVSSCSRSSRAARPARRCPDEPQPAEPPPAESQPAEPPSDEPPTQFLRIYTGPCMQRITSLLAGIFDAMYHVTTCWHFLSTGTLMQSSPHPLTVTIFGVVCLINMCGFFASTGSCDAHHCWGVAKLRAGVSAETAAWGGREHDNVGQARDLLVQGDLADEDCGGQLLGGHDAAVAQEHDELAAEGVPTGDSEGRAGLDVSPREGERFGDGLRRRAESGARWQCRSLGRRCGCACTRSRA